MRELFRCLIRTRKKLFPNLVLDGFKVLYLLSDRRGNDQCKWFMIMLPTFPRQSEVQMESIGGVVVCVMDCATITPAISCGLW